METLTIKYEEVRPGDIIYLRNYWAENKWVPVLEASRIGAKICIKFDMDAKRTINQSDKLYASPFETVKVTRQSMNYSIENLYSIKVVGVSYDNRQEICKRIMMGDKVYLEREPNNFHDSNAIKVLHNNNHFGYIPKETAINLAKILDASLFSYNSTVTNMTGGGNYNIGVHIDIIFSQEQNSNYIAVNETKSNDKGLQNMNYEDLIRSAISKSKSYTQTDTQVSNQKTESAFPLTTEQKDIINHDLKSDETIKVIAFAGTGKTTTLLEYTKAHKTTKFLYVAFNNSVQKSAEKRFPSNVHCKTSHSLAHNKFGWPYRNGKGVISDLRPNEVKKILNIEDYHVAKQAIEILKRYLASADEDFSEKLLNSSQKDLANHDYYHLAIAKQLWEKMKDPEDKTIGMLDDGYLKLYQQIGRASCRERV